MPNPIKYKAKEEKRGTVETCLGRYSTISCNALVPPAHPIVRELRPYPPTAGMRGGDGAEEDVDSKTYHLGEGIRDPRQQQCRRQDDLTVPDPLFHPQPTSSCPMDP